MLHVSKINFVKVWLYYVWFIVFFFTSCASTVLTKHVFKKCNIIVLDKIIFKLYAALKIPQLSGLYNVISQLLFIHSFNSLLHSKLITKSANLHNVGLRHVHFQPLAFFRSTLFKILFLYNSVKLYNILPNNVFKSKPAKNFKALVKNDKVTNIDYFFRYTFILNKFIYCVVFLLHVEMSVFFCFPQYCKRSHFSFRIKVIIKAKRRNL